jgi:hypothetical protein
MLLIRLIFVFDLNFLFYINSVIDYFVFYWILFCILLILISFKLSNNIKILILYLKIE